ncbi:MAG: hypothetical protein BWY85_01178 [Firmicutes bacterium ADurb.Bin506]|nr:MAG: hypothetical protein BWY85_01178 [Firmicutes bacterium ADurb.Bin506]
MYADKRVHPAHIAGVVDSSARGSDVVTGIDHCLNTGYACLCHDGLHAFDVGVVIEVAVGVDQHAYFTLLPLDMGLSGVSVASTIGSPVVDAASSMPLDTSPRSLAGLRFATTTICLPTRSAGE